MSDELLTEPPTEAPEASKIINRAALHRFLRAELLRHGVAGPIPRGGLAALEGLLESHAADTAKQWAQNRKWKQSGGRFGQPELPTAKRTRKAKAK